MKKIRVLCYGDSNTWGFISGSGYRHGDERWTRRLAAMLGDQFEIIEEGLNSRTLLSEDPRPNKTGRNGYVYLIPCLDTHEPLDAVVLMLGTNELKTMYHRTAEEIGEIFEEYFVKTILNHFRRPLQLIIIAPPVVNESAPKKDNNYVGAQEKSEKFHQIYRSIAEKYHCPFIGNEWMETGIDGIHLNVESHEKLACRLTEQLQSLFA